MDLIWSIEDVARTSDDTAVRRRFAQRNGVWLTVLLVLAALVALGQLGSTSARDILPSNVIVGFVNGLWIVLCLWVAWVTRRARKQPHRDSVDTRVGALVLRHVNATTLTFLAIQYAQHLAFTRDDGWPAWVFFYPILTLGLRMEVAELVLIHCYFVAGGFLMAAVFGSGHRGTIPLYIGIVLVNGGALAIELFFSRRMRRDVTGEWTQRRNQAREQLRMRDELRYARELQLSMLPECAPSLDWADVCSVSLPATEVGGDYYDYFVEEERMALVCGDVAGHGMASGLVLSALRSGFTLLRDSLGDPAAVLERLHDLITHTTRRRMLVTVSVVLLDRKQKRAIIASAGHPPVIVRRADGTIETIDLFAPPLGVRLPVVIPQRQLAFSPGDTFVLHSDGIYETRDATDDAYGIGRLENVIRTHEGETAESLRDAILRDVAAFRGVGEQDDDVTVVVCRIT